MTILFLTTTCKERVGAMTMTISRVMHELHRLNETAHFFLAYTDGYKPERELLWLRLLADTLGFDDSQMATSQIHYEDCSGLSVASTKQLVSIGDLHWHTFINLDDDLMVNPKALTYMINRDYLDDEPFVTTYGCWDPINARQFSDWNATKYKSMDEFLREGQQLKHAKVHLFSNHIVVPNYSWISQLYQMPRVVWEDERVWQPVLEQFQQPGVRGYDILLEQKLNEFNHPILYHGGMESIHFGLEEAYLGSKWKSANEIVKNNVTLLGD